MNSLVGYGVSSESDSDGEGSAKEGEEVKNSRNFLLESGSASSDSGGESEPEDEEPSSSPPPHPVTPASPAACQPTPPPPSLGPVTPHKLPPPPLRACSDSSVFANPFRAQAERRLSALQKHVPLTMQAKPSQIGGKRVCVSYRKDGRCRFGIKCKFAHDSDLQTPATPTDCPPAMGDEALAVERVEPHAGGSCGVGSQGSREEEESGGATGEEEEGRTEQYLDSPQTGDEAVCHAKGQRAGRFVLMDDL